MRLLEEPMAGVALIQLQPFSDDRGAFTETFNRAKMAALGIDHEFVQDNESVSSEIGTLRGIHLQLEPHTQGKLVRVLRGAIFDVAVDVRPSSPTYATHCSVELAEGDDRVFWIPPGFGHGFCTLAPNTVVAYKVTNLYEPGADRSIRWDDPQLAIPWPLEDGQPTLSTKDGAAPLLSEIEEELRCD